MRDGAEEICINPFASYGGGGGPLWARIGAEAQLTTDKTWDYIRGACRGFTSDQKAIIFEITQSPHTWGAFKAGHMIILMLEEINRYDDFFQRGQRESEVVPDQLFQRLRSELSAELEQKFRHEVGSENYDKLAELQEALNQARQAYENLPRNFERGSLRNWEKAKRRFINLFEGLHSGE